MSNSELGQVEQIFHEALSLDSAHRQKYLDSACSDNQELLREVESLISAYETGGARLEDSAVTLAMRVMGSSAVEPMAGKEIGPYRVLRKLGHGGMGDVYLAKDCRLNRNVALKFLSTEFIADAWAKRQLIREAQAVAKLDHPNICAVYGFEEIGDYSFIVMQYVEGDTLADLVRKKSLSSGEIIALAQQIVSALAEAHTRGIIHRDIKPRNIMVTSAGQIKVLDFGLAKTTQKSFEDTESISNLSQEGLLVGTVAYMSPEQLRGEKLDPRTDIFSLGVVVYEMISGKNPCARETNAETISAILTSKPGQLSHSGLPVSRELDRIVQRCCEKDRDQRFASADELLSDLENCADFRPLLRWPPRPAFLTAAAIVLVLIAVSFFLVKNLNRTRTVVVLPIANETADASLNYLSDGLTESIIRKLSGLSKLKVKPLTVVSGYKGKPVDARKVGSDLGADSVLVGRITGTKGALRLQTRLIKVSDGSQLLTNEYEIGRGNALEIGQEISQNVTAKLEMWSTADQEKIRTNRSTDNPEAFNQYMLAKHYWANRDKENIKKAIEALDAAIKLDPLYAEAWAGLADCYSVLNTTAYGEMPTREAMDRARAAANRALELDPTLAEAHVALGTINLKYDWQWDAAERELRAAIALKPDLPTAHYWYSLLLSVTGRQSEALSESQLARQFDPFSPVARAGFCRTLYYRREFDKAAQCLNEALKEDPNNRYAKHVLGFVQVQMGNPGAAIQTLSGLPETNITTKAYKLVALGYAYGKAQRRDEALRMLEQLDELAKDHYVPPMEFAVIYLGLGDATNAFIWLEKAYEERFLSLITIRVEPAFDHLRSDPRFTDLARRINVPAPPPG